MASRTLRTQSIGVCRVLGFFEGNSDVTLSRQVVNLVGLHHLDDPNQLLESVISP